MAKAAKDVGTAVAVRARLNSLPARFDPARPEQAKPAIDGYKAAARCAADMWKWDLALVAADKMIEWQTDFVDWWKRDVGVRESAGNNQYKRSSADLRSTMSVSKAEKLTKISHQMVSHWNTRLKRPHYKTTIFKPSHVKAMATEENRAELFTGEMEWFTPAEYIERVRRVLGRIDLDPASCKEAQATVKAKKFFTEKQDGLTKDWRGTVFLNPPYGSKLISAFSQKLLAQLDVGNVTAAIMLTNGYTETAWFHNLARPSNALCLTLGRIKFISPHGEKSAPTNGQCFFYFGDHRDRFLAEFENVGLILVQP